MLIGLDQRIILDHYTIRLGFTAHLIQKNGAAVGWYGSPEAFRHGDNRIGLDGGDRVGIEMERRH